MKILLAKILSKYKFNKCEQTQVSLKINLFKCFYFILCIITKKEKMIVSKSVMLMPEKPIILKVEKRF